MRRLIRTACMATVCVLSMTLGYPNAFLQTDGRGQGAVSVKIGTVKEKLYDGSFALVIGVSDYTNGWPKLPGVKNDVAEVKRVLAGQGFQVDVVMNPTSAALKDRMDQFILAHGYEPGNRLLIYFAGHGHTSNPDDKRVLGYVVPADAPLPQKDAVAFRKSAMSEDKIEAYARQIEAKHALFVFDSCFSGKLISPRRGPPGVINSLTRQPVRQFITSGADNQEVPDKSLFREYFVRGLEGAADLNGDGYVTGSELALYLQDKVTNYSRESQTPQYGKIRHEQLDKGDFVFALSKDRPETPPVQPELKVERMVPVGTIVVTAKAAGMEVLVNGRSVEVSKVVGERFRVENVAAGTSVEVRGRMAGKGDVVKRVDVREGQESAVELGWELPKSFTNSIGMEFVLIPAGSFEMGSNTGDADEKPVHRVTISRVFYMGKYEVTQAQWKAVTGNNVPYFEGDDFPIIVSWNDTQGFIWKLNESNDGYMYRLPSEAEWEYACRAGTTGDWAGDLGTMAWCGPNSGPKTHPVGQKQANVWGLHDMHGNVWEWCEDIWHGDNYDGAPTDGSAWMQDGDQSKRVIRGGAISWVANSCRSASRNRSGSFNRTYGYGFRVVCAPRIQ